jgi:hypothetical protein
MVAKGCRSIYPNLAASMVAVEGLGVDSGRESAVLCSSSISIIILDYLMTYKYRGLQQSSREVKPKFINSTQGESKNIYKP